MISIYNRNNDLAALLIEKGADVNVPNSVVSMISLIALRSLAVIIDYLHCYIDGASFFCFNIDVITIGRYSFDYGVQD